MNKQAQKSAHITVSISKEVYQILAKVADEEQRKMAQLARNILLEGMKARGLV
ncbi:hypothetical protein [Gallibacterium sp. AGMB14963]|uniref:hypothetical protein n=1 Tax=Gallibacterium faecale TaxID=3019086 RepID=UPI0022F187D3|nr:hypothetical protein [Gallibacterium sp. AGMB14963]MDA3979462.1 hypothetical protein [Gallibacterium sp. AGMB14963]